MKKYAIVFSPAAITDVEEAVSYYNQLSQGLGNRFITELTVIQKAIELNPFFASVKYDEIRCASFKRFPFSVHYTVNKKTKIATILAVFNTWKKPFW